MAESEEELKSQFMKVKEESEKVGLKFNIQKSKTVAFSPITSVKIDGEKVEAVTDFIFLGSKIRWFWMWLQVVTGAMKLKDTWPLEGKLWQTCTVY